MGLTKEKQKKEGKKETRTTPDVKAETGPTGLNQALKLRVHGPRQARVRSECP